MIVLCAGFFMTILDATIVNIALPDIVTGLHASLGSILWVSSAYTLALSTLIITAGRLGDLAGVRRVFLAGVVLFTLASALCGMAQAPGQLIAARAVQGVGAALITPQVLTIMGTLFPPGRRATASAVWGAAAGLAGIAGPTLGGLLTTELGWRWIFWMNLPIGIAAIAATPLFVPGVGGTGRPAPLDLPGVLLASSGLAAISFGLLEGGQYHWRGPIPLIFSAGTVLMAAFVAAERARGDQALMPYSLFRDNNFAMMNAVGVAVSFGLVGLALTLTLYLQSASGLSALQAGLRLVPGSIAMIPAFGVMTLLVKRFGGKAVIVTGLLGYAGCLVGIAETAHHGQTGLLLITETAASGIAQAAIFTPLVSVAIRYIPTERLGAASGTLNATRQVGLLIAITIVGAGLEGRLSASQFSNALLWPMYLCAAILALAGLACLKLSTADGAPRHSGDETAFL